MIELLEGQQRATEMSRKVEELNRLNSNEDLLIQLPLELLLDVLSHCDLRSVSRLIQCARYYQKAFQVECSSLSLS